MVSDSADPAMPTPRLAHTVPAGLEDDTICEVHLESDFATLHSSTPGKQFLETAALPEGRRGWQMPGCLMPWVSSTPPPP